MDLLLHYPENLLPYIRHHQKGHDQSGMNVITPRSGRITMTLIPYPPSELYLFSAYN